MRMHGGSLLLVWACLTVKAAAATNFAAYERWLTEEKGYTIGSVTVIEDADGFRRMVATQAIKENFLLVKLPFESSFGEPYVNVTLTGFDGCTDEVLENLDGRTRLVLNVFLHMEDSDSSPWKPWLDMFQQDWKNKDLPVSWKKDDTFLLRGSGQFLEVVKEQSMYDEQYKTLAESCPELTSKFSSNEFLHMAAVITSFGSGEETILPYVDVVNHDGKPNAELGAAEDDGVYALVSTRDIREGEEIFVSYVGEEHWGLPMMPRYGFVDESARGILLLPACIPPSLAGIFEEKSSEAEVELEGFSPELKPCCEDTVHSDDKFCFATRVREPTAQNSFPFALGPIADDGRERSTGDLDQVIHRIRTLVQDSGFLNDKCSRDTIDPERPMSMAAEILVMRIFKAVLLAHLDESSWAHVAGGTPPPPAEAAIESRVKLARSAMLAERGVFNWYVAAANFVEEHLQLGSTEALQEKLCEEVMWHRARPKAKLQGFSKYTNFVETVLAPLAFRPNEENGEPCSVKEASYKLTPKECKVILKLKKGRHDGGEL